MINISALKDEVVTLLAGEIGIYTFASGLTTPAVRIVDGSDPFPEEPSIAGLELVIEVERDIEYEPMLNGDRRVAVSSNILLKQWDEALTTRSAGEKLLKNLSNLEEVQRLPRNEAKQIVETFIFRVQQDFAYFG